MNSSTSGNLKLLFGPPMFVGCAVSVYVVLEDLRARREGWDVVMVPWPDPGWQFPLAVIAILCALQCALIWPILKRFGERRWGSVAASLSIAVGVSQALAVPLYERELDTWLNVSAVSGVLTGLLVLLVALLTVAGMRRKRGAV